MCGTWQNWRFRPRNTGPTPSFAESSPGRIRFLTLCLPFLLLAGCNGAGDEQTPERGPVAKPFSGLDLSVAVPAGRDFPAAWKIDMDEWSARTGAACRLVEYDAAATGSDLAETLGLEGGQSGPSLLVFPITQIGELASDNLLAPIPQEMQSPEFLHWNDLFRGLRESVGTLEQQPSVVPLAAPVLVGYYRKDIFERENLQPPATWDEYRSLLTALHQRGLKVLEPWSPDFRATMFLSRAVAYARHPYQYSLFFDINSGRPLIDGPGFVRALELARDDVAELAKTADVTRYGPADCRRDFLSGKAAMAIAFETPGTSGGPLVERPREMRIGFFRLPGSLQVFNTSTNQWEKPPESNVNDVTLTAFEGWCAGVSARASSDEQRAAWNFLAQIAVDTSALVRAFPGQTKSPCRQSHVSRPDIWVGRELSPGEARQYVAVVSESLRDVNLVAELPVPAQKRFRDVLTAALADALSGETPPAEALAQAAAQWERIAAEVGRQRLLNGYRRCLGLFPLDDPQ